MEHLGNGSRMVDDERSICFDTLLAGRGDDFFLVFLVRLKLVDRETHFPFTDTAGQATAPTLLVAQPQSSTTQEKACLAVLEANWTAAWPSCAGPDMGYSRSVSSFLAFSESIVSRSVGPRLRPGPGGRGAHAAARDIAAADLVHAPRRRARLPQKVGCLTACTPQQWNAPWVLACRSCQ